MPRLLLKLPKDDRDELRLCKESGVGLDDARGDLVRARAGDLVSERGGGKEGVKELCMGDRRC